MTDKKDKKPNPVDIYVGGRLRLRRMMCGLSQEVLGEKVGVTFQQIQKYERGTNRIGASRLYEISEHLNTPISFFFQGYKKETNEMDDLPVSFEDLNIQHMTIEGIKQAMDFSRIDGQEARNAIRSLTKWVLENEIKKEEG